ncbi:MAG: PEGA domain-containing protein [Patescibacteria group bacterium]
MKLANRRILFLGFVVLFCGSAVGVILYTNGYRYHPKKKSIEKTGELVVETIPNRSDIYLNGEKAFSHIFGLQAGQAQTPTTVSYLPSGDYRLELKKEGYYPWTADITVYSGRSTLVKDRELLKMHEPQLLVQQQGIAALERIDAARICFSAGNDIFVFNESTKQSERIYHGSALDQSFLLPSPRGTKLIIRDKGLYQIVDIESADVTVLERQSQWKGIQWLSEQRLLATTPTSALAIALPSQKQEIIYRGAIGDSVHIDGAAMLLVHSNNGSTLLRVSGEQGIQTTEMAHFPAMFKSIASTYDRLVALQDKKNDLFLYDAASPTTALVQLPKGRLYWQSRNRFALTNDFELWIYEKSGDGYQSSLITRQSNTISDIFFINDSSYIFFVSDKKIKAIDVSVAGALNRYVFEGDDTGSSILSNDGTRLYSTTMIKGERGLFEVVGPFQR